MALLTGFCTSGSLIMAIGAQNAFVIRQGLQRQHLFLTALLCSFIDALLILLGAIGFDHLIEAHPLFLDVAHYGAILFLLVYGAIAFISAFNNSSLDCAKEAGSSTPAKKVILTLLALSLLNPHVYLDTVILLGSLVSQQPISERISFTLGAMTASFTWFFSITFGARMLAPFFQKPSAWRVIDGSVALVMWGMAFTLLNY